MEFVFFQRMDRMGSVMKGLFFSDLVFVLLYCSCIITDAEEGGYVFRFV